MLALPPVAAAARALAAAALGGLVAADTHPPVTRAPATAAMASMAATRFLYMTNLPLHQGCDWVALTAGSHPGGEPEPPFARGPVLSIMCACRSRGTIAQLVGCRCGKASARDDGFITWDASACCGMEGEGHTVPIDWMQALWPLLLRTSATASSPAEMTTHSISMACCQPRRRYRRCGCGRAVPGRGRRRARRGRWPAGRRAAPGSSRVLASPRLRPAG